MTKRTNKQYPNDFKQEAVALVTEQGYSVVEVAASLNITDKPPKGLVFHSDRVSQYTSKRFRSLLKRLHCRASMGDVGACWDNAVVKRFFGSFKHDWLFKVAQLKPPFKGL
jgi:transposase InsO family protein